MLKFVRLSLFFILLILNTATLAQMADPVDPEVSFEAGNRAAQSGDFEEALEHYEASLEAGGKSPGLYWNAGNAAQRIGRGQEAIKYFSLLKEIEPTDYLTLSKLVQCYQELGQVEQRDKQRAELYELWKESGPDSEIRERGLFCRDQFSVGERPIMVFEHFELDSPRGVKYVFLVLLPDEEKEDYRLSLGSYDATNAFFHETEELDDNVRIYHLDGYYDGGAKHSTFRFFEGLPDYDKLKSMVESAIAGDLKPMSGSERKEDGEVQITLPADES
jgi:tetratricopeptide (TPR) repeat protein